MHEFFTSPFNTGEFSNELGQNTCHCLTSVWKNFPLCMRESLLVQGRSLASPNIVAWCQWECDIRHFVGSPRSKKSSSCIWCLCLRGFFFSGSQETKFFSRLACALFLKPDRQWIYRQPHCFGFYPWIFFKTGFAWRFPNFISLEKEKKKFFDNSDNCGYKEHTRQFNSPDYLRISYGNNVRLRPVSSSWAMHVA